MDREKLEALKKQLEEELAQIQQRINEALVNEIKTLKGGDSSG